MRGGCSSAMELGKKGTEACATVGCQTKCSAVHPTRDKISEPFGSPPRVPLESLAVCDPATLICDLYYQIDRPHMPQFSPKLLYRP
jgi:hypothetical protein